MNMNQSRESGRTGGDALTRREFVRVAGAAATLPVMAGGLLVPSHARAAQPEAGKKLRIGLIGCGGRGTGAATQALKADKDTVLVAMGDVFDDRLKSSLKGITEEMGDKAAAQVQVAEDKRFLGFDSYQKVIDSGVDVVLLTSYPAFRPAHLRAAVEAGKHVFAEKPLAVDAPGLRSVVESARKAKEKNLGLLVGFCWRYNDGMKATFGEIANGGLGEVVTAHTTYHTSTLGKRPRQPGWSDTEFQLRNWWHFTWVSGDHIVEQAVHSIDRLSWALGDRLPQKVICLGGRAARNGPEHGNVFDHFAAVYEYEGGMRAFHTTRQIDACPNDNTDYVYGLKGSATINGWVPTYQIKDRSGKETWKYTGPNDRDMYQNEHDEFFKSIRAGTPINDGERGANSTMLALMARMAAYTGQTISWKQAWESKESLVPEHLEMGPLPTPEVAVPGKTKFA
ncbi:MAG: Gfo/Idh/MocA family oxidoreductase [Planctomycetes bacterium]|nr:Gfo/Idh/MocA family oxidoreductase [Planctomycetota bacterium]